MTQKEFLDLHYQQEVKGQDGRIYKVFRRLHNGVVELTDKCGRHFIHYKKLERL